jgi:glycosyltransferase involved in cell wall biosynthesis
MPKVSVIIPAYNAMVYLPETLESVLRQTFTDFEVLIINDGSSDNIVEWYSSVKDPRVRLISQQNQGVSVARNTGISQAQGEYIAFLDADDLWEPTKVEKQVTRLDNELAVGLVYAWTALIDPAGKLTGTVFCHKAEGNVWETILVHDIVCNGSCAMVRRSCFEKAGVFDPNLSSAADFDMWTRIAAHYPFAVVKECLVHYRKAPDTMSKNRQKMIQDFRITLEKRYQSVPLELLYLRNRAYGHMYRWQAWLSLYEGDYKSATHFYKQALLHNPLLLSSKNFLHLSLGIILVRLFGSHLYERSRSLSRALRQRMFGAST